LKNSVGRERFELP